MLERARKSLCVRAGIGRDGCGTGCAAGLSSAVRGGRSSSLSCLTLRAGVDMVASPSLGRSPLLFLSKSAACLGGRLLRCREGERERAATARSCVCLYVRERERGSAAVGPSWLAHAAPPLPPPSLAASRARTAIAPPLLCSFTLFTINHHQTNNQSTNQFHPATGPAPPPVPTPAPPPSPSSAGSRSRSAPSTNRALTITSPVCSRLSTLSYPLVT